MKKIISNDFEKNFKHQTNSGRFKKNDKKKE